MFCSSSSTCIPTDMKKIKRIDKLRKSLMKTSKTSSSLAIRRRHMDRVDSPRQRTIISHVVDVWSSKDPLSRQSSGTRVQKTVSCKSVLKEKQIFNQNNISGILYGLWLIENTTLLHILFRFRLNMSKIPIAYYNDSKRI